MSKWSVKLELRDIYAIKHCLQDSIEQKETELFLDRLVSIDNLSAKKREELNKDIVHEIALLERIIKEINGFKEAKGIKTKEDLYVK